MDEDIPINGQGEELLTPALKFKLIHAREELEAVFY